MRKFFQIAAILSVAALCVAWADGTVSTSDLLQSLGPTNPQLAQTLRDGFDLDKDAVGGMIGRAVNAELSGTRIGPYTIHGRLKQASHPTELLVILNTEIAFLDSQKHKTDKVATAASVKESLKSIEIRIAPERPKAEH